MTLPTKIRDFGWFGAGWSVFCAETDDDDYFPPLDDLPAQREWLGGFAAAWAEYPDDEAIESILYGDETGGERVEAALVRVLQVQGRSELLRRLLMHRGGNRTTH